MKKQILVVVDYQGDFVNGVLPVPGAETISQNIQNEINNQNYEHIIYTFDTHTCKEYQVSEEKQLFPNIHCEFKTDGWKLFDIKPRNKKLVKAIVKKAEVPFENITINNESFFCKNKFDIFEGNKVYSEWLEKSFNPEIYDVVVSGVATNYCVFSHVMGLIERGYNVIIKENCVKGITNFPDGTVDESYNKNIEIMKNNNVNFEK